MIAQAAYIIALVCAGFLMGVLLDGRPRDCATQQVTPISKATATIHQYRHTPYAIPN